MVPVRALFYGRSNSTLGVLFWYRFLSECNFDRKCVSCVVTSKLFVTTNGWYKILKELYFNSLHKDRSMDKLLGGNDISHVQRLALTSAPCSGRGLSCNQDYYKSGRSLLNLLLSYFYSTYYSAVPTQPITQLFLLNLLLSCFYSTYYSAVSTQSIYYSAVPPQPITQLSLLNLLLSCFYSTITQLFLLNLLLSCFYSTYYSAVSTQSIYYSAVPPQPITQLSLLNLLLSWCHSM